MWLVNVPFLARWGEFSLFPILAQANLVCWNKINQDFVGSFLGGRQTEEKEFHFRIIKLQTARSGFTKSQKRFKSCNRTFSQNFGQTPKQSKTKRSKQWFSKDPFAALFAALMTSSSHVVEGAITEMTLSDIPSTAKVYYACQFRNQWSAVRPSNRLS